MSTQELLADVIGGAAAGGTYRHRWQAGDVVITDNYAAMHTAAPGTNFNDEPRLIQRVCVPGGYLPQPLPACVRILHGDTALSRILQACMSQWLVFTQVVTIFVQWIAMVLYTISFFIPFVRDWVCMVCCQGRCGIIVSRLLPPRAIREYFIII